MQQQYPTRGLVIAEPWIDYILQGTKDWEIRSSNCKIRGPIALIRKGSGRVEGVANMKGTVGPLSLEQLRQNVHRHRVPTDQLVNVLGRYKSPMAWVLENVRRLDSAIPYMHSPGAVIWVKLDHSAIDEIRLTLETL